MWSQRTWLWDKQRHTSDKITKTKSAQVGIPADGQVSSTNADTPPAFTPEEEKNFKDNIWYC